MRKCPHCGTTYENKLIDKPELVRSAYILSTAPSNQEVGTLGHKRFVGTKDKIQIKFDPSDPEIQDHYVFHTHPSEDPSPLSAMPSIQDLRSAAEETKAGIHGVVIFSGKYYTVIAPTNKIKENPDFAQYMNFVKNGDIEDALKALERLGFDIETGVLD